MIFFKSIYLYLMVGLLSSQAIYEGKTDNLNTQTKEVQEIIKEKPIEFTIEDVIAKYKDEPMSLENVASAIIDLKIHNPVLAFKQTIKESGWKNKKTAYKSGLANVGNNLFGMRKARKRKNLALDKKYMTYATFSCWIHSVVDFKYWQDYRPIGDDEDYRDYLVRRGYARNTRAYVSNFDCYRLPEKVQQILERSSEMKDIFEIADTDNLAGSMIVIDGDNFIVKDMKRGTEERFIVELAEDKIILKVGSGKQYENGISRYVPPEYIIGKIEYAGLSTLGKKRYKLLDKIVSIKFTRKNMKKAKDKAREIFDNL